MKTHSPQDSLEESDLWQNAPIPDNLINRHTGQPPTEVEWQAIKTRARQILANPYASPESVEWALWVAPDGIAVMFDERLSWSMRRAR
jgi:hypothetical protein